MVTDIAMVLVAPPSTPKMNGIIISFLTLLVQPWARLNLSFVGYVPVASETRN